MKELKQKGLPAQAVSLPYEGDIHKSMASKETVKAAIIFGVIISLLITVFTIVRFYGEFHPSYTDAKLNFILFWIVFWLLVIYGVILIINFTYYRAYVNAFRFVIQQDRIVIYHGVFTKVEGTIAFTRVQNVNIERGVFDRAYKLSTIKVETAGSSAAAKAAQSGIARPEGYIPAVRNGEEIVKILKSVIMRSSVIPGNLGDLQFTPQDVAFDNFIAYILTKMREGDELKNQILTLREKKGWTQEQLAQKVGVRVDTIDQLEKGRYNPSLALALRLGKVLGANLEQVFALDEGN